MSLFEKVLSAYPELAENKDVFVDGTIRLQNDSDGTGDYIAAWNYSQPIPESLSEYDRTNA
jgi:hypothetical protein